MGPLKIDWPSERELKLMFVLMGVGVVAILAAVAFAVAWLIKHLQWVA